MVSDIESLLPLVRSSLHKKIHKDPLTFFSNVEHKGTRGEKSLKMVL